jgi:hypothetical protein
MSDFCTWVRAIRVPPTRDDLFTRLYLDRARLADSRGWCNEYRRAEVEDLHVAVAEVRRVVVVRGVVLRRGPAKDDP